jgi:cellulose synthase/poly-beta-1,6-N-acetylglucosamine synthase-like glycosyltransferase
MSTALTVLLGVAAALLLLPTLSDLLSLCRLSVRPRRGAPPSVSSEESRLLFLVPAHDEEILLSGCLQTLLAQTGTGTHTIVVVADNCTDQTADIARSMGVRCLERHDDNHRGKPYALAWALEQMPLEEWDGVVIVDGDTEVDPDFASAMAKAGPLRSRVVQPLNDVSNPTESALTRMAAVLSTANHRFAFGLKTRTGLNVPLSAGMCIGTDILRAHGWPAYSICEDWEFYAFLTVRGIRTLSYPEARIRAQEAKSLAQSASQRQRWQVGKLAVLTQYVGPILRSKQVSVFGKLDCLAELTAVGPAVHLALVGVLSVVAVLAAGAQAPLLAAVLAGSLVRPGVYTVLAIAKLPDTAGTLRAFAYLPIYAVWRFVAAFGAVTGWGDKRWIRTARHANGSDDRSAQA